MKSPHMAGIVIKKEGCRRQSHAAARCIAEPVAAELAGFSLAGIRYSAEPVAVVDAAAVAAGLAVLAGGLAAVVAAECHSPGCTGASV